MSGIIEQALYSQESGLNEVPDKNLCSDHFNELSIKKFIKKGASSGYCDYCEKNKQVIPLNELMEFFISVINSHGYTDPANFMSYNSQEGGYLGDVYESREVLEEHFNLNIEDNNLFQDVFDSFDPFTAWADYAQYHDELHHWMIYSWDYFKGIVTNRSRYFFGQVKDLKNSEEYLINSNQILDEIGKAIKKFKLIKKLPINTEFYRCRQHSQSDKSVVSAEGMTSPPPQFATYPNRMSPAGISMFYAAFDIETTIAEVLNYDDKDKGFYTTGKFISKKELNVIDFTELPKPRSFFDLKNVKDKFLINFLIDFIKEFSAPIQKDNRIHINYVPTQIITEYFRFPFSNKLKAGKQIDGIIYSSSKNNKKACVLFLNNEESLKVLDMDYKSLNKKEIKPKGSL